MGIRDPVSIPSRLEIGNGDKRAKTGSTNLHVFDGAGGEGLVVPAAVAAGAGNGLSGYWVTLT